MFMKYFKDAQQDISARNAQQVRLSFLSSKRLKFIFTFTLTLLLKSVIIYLKVWPVLDPYITIQWPVF